MLFWLKECSDGGKFNIHSIDEFVELEKLIIFFFYNSCSDDND